MGTLSTAGPAARPFHDRRLLAAALGAAGANLALFAVGNAAGATWVTMAPQPVGPVIVAAATLVPLLGAGAVLRSIAVGRPGLVRVAAWAGLIFAVVGLPMPFVASSDLTTSLALAPMHVTTGLAWFLAVRPAR